MKAIVTKLNDIYTIELDNYAKLSVMIDGERFDDFIKGQIKSKPSKVQLIENSCKIVSYGTGESLLSIEKYEEGLRELKSKHYDTVSERWLTLEGEFAYRKFVSDHPENRLHFESFEDIQIIYLEYKGNVDIPEIQPLRLLGMAHIFKDNELLYSYTPNPQSIAQRIGEKYGFTQTDDSRPTREITGATWSVPKHSLDHLEFIKIDNEYANMSKAKFYGISAGTWDECKGRYDQHFSCIEGWFKKARRDVDAVGLPIDKSMALKELQSIVSILNSVSVKSSSRVNFISACGKINELMQKL